MNRPQVLQHWRAGRLHGETRERVTNDLTRIASDGLRVMAGGTPAEMVSFVVNNYGTTVRSARAILRDIRARINRQQ